MRRKNGHGMPCPYESVVILDVGAGIGVGTWFFTRKSVPHLISYVKSFLRYYVAGLDGIAGGPGRVLQVASLNRGVLKDGLHKLLILEGLVRLLATWWIGVVCFLGGCG